jgi:glyoxylase-like metal-dependent hydrolase (beta-lactamase superfamily II)
MMRVRVRRHGDHLTQLSYLGLVNAYLIRDNEGLTLVDTLLPGADGGIRRAADDLALPITRIVLTHAHIDHAGTLDALKHAIGDAEVIVGTREARFLEGDNSLDRDEPPGRIVSMRSTTTRPGRTVAPGEQIGSLEVHAAPGHTPGQIALIDTRDRTLIAGDSWITFGATSTAASPELPFPFTAIGSWHSPTALATARSLSALQPARLAAGHGPVINEPRSAMTAAIGRAESRLKAE